MNYKYIHKDFILTPIENVIKGAIYATHSIANGVEGYPLSDYVMQSLFLKMTGFQEQKLKCLSWELASNDLDYRFIYMKERERGYSTFADKRKLYNELMALIIEIKSDYSITRKFTIGRIIIQSFNTINDLFTEEIICTWNKRSFLVFLDLVADKEFIKGKDISFKVIYEKYLYRERNRIAHNTLSYQENLPTFKSLKDTKNQFNNYFLFFTILTIIDRVFIKLYKDYLDLLKSG